MDQPVKLAPLGPVELAAQNGMVLPARRAVKSQAPSSYTVQPGDTLWAIAAQICGAGADYPSLAEANGIPDPNLILAGQVLHSLVCHMAVTQSASQAAQPQSSSDNDSDSDGSSSSNSSAPPPVSPPVNSAASTSSVGGGTLSCSGLEALWMAAGGSSGAAFMAAEIAMAESGGQQDAVSPSDDYGYWQINMPSWGPAMATFDPIGNAKAAIQISGNGTNWTPWTTYTSGAYNGRC